MLSRKAREGDFPLLVSRKRGPFSLPYIISKATSIEHFQELIKEYLTARNINKIAARTKEQSNSPAWFLYKRSIITGTSCKYVLNQNLKNVVNVKLNQRLTRTFQSNFKTEAMIYGIANESIALDVFLKGFKIKHKNARIHTTGLTLYKEAPYIGGSPDGFVSCDCCPQPVLVETKAPFRLREVGLTSWRLLEYLDEGQNLRKNHSYYHQINLYLGIFNLQKAYFIVYAKQGVLSKVINFDKEFFEYQIKNLKEYYLTKYLPSLLGKVI